MQVLPWILDVGFTILAVAVLIAFMGHILFGDFEVTMATLSSSIAGTSYITPDYCPAWLAWLKLSTLNPKYNTAWLAYSSADMLHSKPRYTAALLYTYIHHKHVQHYAFAGAHSKLSSCYALHGMH